MKTTFQAIEDNGGGLHLAVFNEAGECIYFHSGFEFDKDTLSDCIGRLRMGEGTEDWEGNSETPREDYENLTSFEYGWEVISDEEGVYPDKMGAAARKEFEI